MNTTFLPCFFRSLDCFVSKGTGSEENSLGVIVFESVAFPDSSMVGFDRSDAGGNLCLFDPELVVPDGSGYNGDRSSGESKEETKLKSENVFRSRGKKLPVHGMADNRSP